MTDYLINYYNYIITNNLLDPMQRNIEQKTIIILCSNKKLFKYSHAYFY